jgi:hypothetical protein
LLPKQKQSGLTQPSKEGIQQVKEATSKHKPEVICLLLVRRFKLSHQSGQAHFIQGMTMANLKLHTLLQDYHVRQSGT